MDISEQYTQIARDLETQAQFLRTQIDVYETTELGRDRLRELVESLKKAAALMAEHPPRAQAAALAPKTAEGAEAEAEEGPEEPAERPEDPEDLMGWLAFLLQNPEDEEASQAVDRLHAEAKEEGRWDQVVDVHLARVELTDSVEGRISELEEVARIYEQQIGDLGKAFAAVLAAGSEDPKNDHLADEMERLAEATEQWSDLVTTWNQILTDLDDRPLAARLWLKLGRVYNERLDRADYAVSSLWHALEQNPALSEAWDELATIYKQKEQWGDLVQVLVKRLETTEEKQDRIFFLLELADLYESRIGQPDEARLCYEEVLSLDPENPDALASLETVLRQLELWEPLVGLLERKAESTEDADRARAARREAADLLRFQLEDPEAAAPYLETELEKTPDDVEILRALYDIYDDIARSADFLRVAERLAELVEDDDSRVQIYRRMAGEMQTDPELRMGAADVLEKIIDLGAATELTFRDLEDIYIKEEAWDELVAAYRRHAGVAESTVVKCEVLRAMAAVEEEHLEDSEAAADALRGALEADPEDLDALVHLSSLLDRLGQWVELADVLSRRAELTSEELERVELLRRIGEVALEKLGDPETAEQRLMKALELDPDNVGAMMALTTLYKSREEWLRAASMLTDAEQATGNRLEKARLLFEAAELHRAQLEDMDKAVALYAKAMLVDPEHVPSATQLADHYFQQEMWEEAEPLYDLLLRKTDDSERKRRTELHTRVGLVAKRLKKAEKAMRNLEAARDMDPTSLQVLRELADLKYHLEAWKDAATLYQAILVAHREAVSAEYLVEVYHRLGSVKMELGEKEKALNLYEKALEIDATYEPSVKAVLLLREEGGDYDRIAATKRAMMEKTDDPSEKGKLALEVGDLYASKLDQPQKALELYRKAIELQPENRAALHKMLEIHTAAEQWDKAVDIVLQLADMEPNQAVQAKYVYTAALIYRDELKKPEMALEQLERCLEDDPGFEDSFESIVRILEDRADWTELARSIRRQYKRMPETADAKKRISLLDRLGDIYAEKLGETETAVAAYEAAELVEPDNSERNAKLAQLYLQAGPDKLDKAIYQHHALLRKSPYRIQLYKDLTELYIRAQKKDETWCMCAALVFLKKASEKEQIFFERYRPGSLVLAQRKLSDQLWREKLRHPAESIKINAIFAGVKQQAALITAQPHKRFGLKRSERTDPEQDERQVMRMFVYASRVLDIEPRPEVFVRPDQPQLIQVANASDKGTLLPTWLLDAPKFDNRSPRETVFEVARQLAHMRPERYLWRAMVSQADLFNVLYAAMAIMIPDAPVPDTPEVQRVAGHLKRTVPPVIFEQLLPVARELLSSSAEEANLANWILATQKTALRAGLLLTSDFQTVARLVATEPDSVTGLAAKDRVADLLQFSVSPEYFELRKHLGFAVS